MKGRGLSADTIKFLAVLAMLAGHAAHVFGEGWGPVQTWMIRISYMTAPVMCFFLAEGYSYTRSFAKYLKRMLFFAVLAEIPFRLAFGGEAAFLDMLFTLALGLLILKVTDPSSGYAQEKKKGILWLLFGLSIFMDWGISAPFLIWKLGEARKLGRPLLSAFPAWLVLHGCMSAADAVLNLGLAGGLADTAGQLIGPLLAWFFLSQYRGGKREKANPFTKWFFYAFYPGHLAVLCLVRAFL